MPTDFYRLDYSGAQVNDAIRRVLEEQPDDPDKVSHITNLESTEADPFNLDTLTEIGFYRCMYASPSSVPAAVAAMHPIYIINALVEDSPPAGTGVHICQTVIYGVFNYRRLTSNDGATWTAWEYPRPITADEVLAMFSNGQTTPQTRAMVQDKVEHLESQTSNETKSTLKTQLRHGYAM